MKFAAVLPAGGVGSRMGADKPKQFLELQGKALWRHALEAFLQHPAISEIALVCHPDWTRFFQDEIAEHYTTEQQAKIRYAIGGAERWISVKNGIEALSNDVDYALVHDVARPLLSQEIIDSCIHNLKEHGACLVAKAVVDTVKRVASQRVKETLDRSEIYLAQTPQCFSTEALKAAYERMPSHPEFTPTDEASMMEFFGHQVPICAGHDLNDKVTTPFDLIRLELLAQHHLHG